MARGNQRDKAREKTQKEAAASVTALHYPDPLSILDMISKLTIGRRRKIRYGLYARTPDLCTAC